MERKNDFVLQVYARRTKILAWKANLRGSLALKSDRNTVRKLL